MTFAARETSRTLGEPIHLIHLRGADPTLESMTTAITLGTGLGEYVLSTTKVKRNGLPLNWRPGMQTYLTRSIRDLKNVMPHVRDVTLTVCWHGTDLRIGLCNIRPRKGDTEDGDAFNWFVGGVGKTDATNSSDGRGAPADRAVYEAIQHLKSEGFRVYLKPVIFMDLPPENTKPSPYGGTQPAYPWQGLATCDPAPGQPDTVDKTSVAGDQVATFFGDVAVGAFGWNTSLQRVTYTGPADQWSYRRFILSYARLAAAAGVNGFYIGAGLAGVTRIRGAAGGFTAIPRLKTLAADCRTILGGAIDLGYEADWTEYHSYRPRDGSNDVFFNLDSLWVDLDFVGINWTAPMADWRDGDLHKDRADGWASVYDWEYLQHGIEGGEDYDWRYAGEPARKSQVRAPIVDPVHNEPWVLRSKDVRNWWANTHRDRPAGSRANGATGWVAKSKPIRFTVSVLPIDKGANGGRDRDTPPFSNGRPDEVMQRAGIEAFLDYWRRSAPAGMVAAVSPWYWDVRPYPTYPIRDREEAVAAYEQANTLSGRAREGQSFQGESIPEIGVTDSETPVTRGHVVYQPATIQGFSTVDNGSLDKSRLSLRLAQGTAIDALFKAFPPQSGVNLTIRRGHVGDDPNDPLCFKIVWAGRALEAMFPKHQTVLECEPIQSAMLRPGLRRRYQLDCPHVLYGPKCRANRARASISLTVASAIGPIVTLTGAGLPQEFDPKKFAAGIAQWPVAGGYEIRTIIQMPDQKTVLLRGIARNLPAGTVITLSLGCNHRQVDCKTLHDNILNFGGHPFIPTENPFSNKNQYY